MSKIILIGGPPRCGKTTLAQKISKAANMPWISTDAFDDIAKRYVSDDDVSTLFPKTDLRKKGGNGNDEMYAAFPVEDIVDAYRRQAKTVHKAIESFVACANKEGWDYIIEGYHVTPKLISKLESEGSNISSIILVSDGDKAVERSMGSNAENDWLRDKTKKQETFPKIGAMIDLYSNRLKQEADEFNVSVVDTGDNFEEKLNEAFKLLVQ